MLEVQLLMRLVGDPDRLSWVKGQPGPLRQIQAVHQLLSRNLDFEQKYLERLEGRSMEWIFSPKVLGILLNIRW